MFQVSCGRYGGGDTRPQNAVTLLSQASLRFSRLFSFLFFLFLFRRLHRRPAELRMYEHPPFLPPLSSSLPSSPSLHLLVGHADTERKHSAYICIINSRSTYRLAVAVLPNSYPFFIVRSHICRREHIQ